MKTKPKKPRADFPLFPHASGQWAKKIKGNLRYFGVWSDAEGALNKYLDEANHWQAGRTPPGKSTTVADILDGFLGDKNRLLETGEIGQRTYDEYEAVCDTIADTLGKASSVELLSYDDLADLRTVLSKNKRKGTVSPVTHKRLLTFARMVFNHANEEMGQSIRYKKALRSPKARTIREARNKVGERLFTAAQLRKLVKLARPQLRAMILLGVNCGFGNADCGTLPIEQLDLKGGWHRYWRPKTQVARRCPLWPETVKALKAVVGKRTSGLVFVTKYGNPWTVEDGGRDPLAYEFRKLTTKAKIHRNGVTTFYSLRRTFETIAATADVNQSVIDHIMGHTRDDMASIYRQKTFDDQLHKCVEHVRAWCLGSVTLK